MYSLQSRLGLWLAIMLVVLFAVHILFVGHFSRYLAEERVITRLQHDSDSLQNRLMLRGNGMFRMSPGPISPIYQNPGSGHYFQLEYKGTILRSPSLDEKTLIFPKLGHKISDTFRIEGPSGEPLLVWVVRANKFGETFIMAIAEEIADIQEDIDDQRSIYFIATALTVLLLIVLQTLVIRKNMAPVEKARQELLAVEQGELKKIHQQLPSEIQPLVDELNLLLETMNKRLERSRNATGNLAHALKTPLSVLRQLSESKDVQDDPEVSEEISQITDSIQNAIDRELKRARLSGAAVIGQRFKLNEELTELVNVMQKVYAHKKLKFDVNIPIEQTVQADREDMLEMFGNLLDNAGKWADKNVRLTVLNEPGLHFIIEDDGVGIGEDGLDILTQRGTRLDESTPGHGLGLAIVAEIVEQWDGSIKFSHSPTLGGLLVDVQFPRL